MIILCNFLELGHILNFLNKILLGFFWNITYNPINSYLGVYKMKFLRISDVAEKTALSESTIWLWINEQKFPKPIKLSPKVTIWEETKVDEWMQLKLSDLQSN